MVWQHWAVLVPLAGAAVCMAASAGSAVHGSAGVSAGAGGLKRPGPGDLAGGHGASQHGAPARRLESKSISDGDTDNSVGVAISIILICLFFFLLAVALAIVVWRKMHDKQEKREESKDPAEMGEWLYLSEGQSKGPCTNSAMRQLLQDNVISRETEAKVVWWTGSYRSISSLFPEQGTEFMVPAKAEEEAVKAPWHRYSVLSQPPGPALPPMMWSYMTPFDTQEGPFETGKMRHWFLEGYFKGETLIRLEEEESTEFLPLSEFFPAVSEAFTSIPQNSRLAFNGGSSPEVLGNTR